ncbi:MAG TPA: hypothetical protein VIY08_09830 [Candidatus Nitrosocosmicus sp.]
MNQRHHLHSSFEKDIIERIMQHIKDRVNRLMTAFLVERTCKLNHVKQRLGLFVDQHIEKIIS